MIAARNGKTDAVVELIKGGATIDLKSIVCCLFLLMLCIRYQYLVSGV